MSKYKVGDVLMNNAGRIRVIASEAKNVFFLAGIDFNGNVRKLPHFKNHVLSNFYKRVVI
jgi:hypothetical protein